MSIHVTQSMHNLKKIKLFRIILALTYPISLIFIYPFSALKKKNSARLFFFLDRYAIGGAQKVYLDILNSVDDVPKQVYFTRKSSGNDFKKKFYSLPETKCEDIHVWCDYLLFRIFTVHYYAFYLNRHEPIHVFSSNSTFFFDMLPYLKKNIVKTELLHNFGYGKGGFEFFGLANYKYLNNRIVVDEFTVANIKQQYKQYDIDPEFCKRIRMIEPGVFVAPVLHKDYSVPLKILYAGRGGPQKRVWLLSKIADYFARERLPVEFHFAGPMIDELPSSVKHYAILHGNISDPEQMNSLYSECHVILMTSAYEGFPMLIKEGMAFGCIPIVTALPGNRMHLSENSNALLIDINIEEPEVIRQAIEKIKLLLYGPDRLRSLSLHAYSYAKEHFTKSRFVEQYRGLLLNGIAVHH